MKYDFNWILIGVSLKFCLKWILHPFTTTKNIWNNILMEQHGNNSDDGNKYTITEQNNLVQDKNNVLLSFCLVGLHSIQWIY